MLYDLPNNLLSEFIKYNELFINISKTTTGNPTFTSSTSGATYTVSNNTGEVGLQQLLKTALRDYMILASDFNSLSSGSIPYGGVTTNIGNAYSVLSPLISTLVDGMAVSVKINANSTAPVTLNWNNTGAKSVKKPTGADVVFFKDGIYTVRYNGVNYILQSANDDDTALIDHKNETDTAHGINTKMPKSGGTFTGQVKAQNNTAYTTAQIRNIVLWNGSGAKPATSNGDILITYIP